MPRYNAKTDSNHAEFAAAFKHLDYQYKDVHAYPGMLDFMVRTKGSYHRLIWFEVKSGPNEQLTEAEKQTFAMFPNNCFRVESVQQAIDILCEADEEGEW